MDNNGVDSAWVALGVGQIAILREQDGQSRNNLAKSVLVLFEETVQLYGLEHFTLIKLANTSLEHSITLGLTVRKDNKYWLTNLGSDTDLGAVSSMFSEWIEVGDAGSPN